MADAGAVAVAVLDELRAEDLAAVRARFSPTLAAALSEAQLSASWQMLLSQAGAVAEVGSPDVQGDVAVLPIRLRAAALELVVRLEADGSVGGLLLRPPPPKEAMWVAPRYVDAKAFEERSVEVGDGPPLPGTLRVPHKGRPVPGAVILHGSGPGDRDGTVSTVKPYRDLACGLASRGVAVLTFDKRTKAAPGSLPPDSTVEHEYLADARAAVALLADYPAVDARRIVVIGHSQGAVVAPRLAAEGAPVAGLVLLCAPSRTMDVLALEQIRFQVANGSPATEQQLRDGLRLDEASCARLADLRAGRPVDGPLALGLSASYWSDLDATDPVATAAALDIPVHVVHGGRDAQVFPADLQAWQRAAAGASNLRVSVHKKANHLLVEGRGGPRIEPYDDFAHVSPDVIKELAGVITSVPPRRQA